MADGREVQIGDRKIRVQRFSTFKVIEATDIVTSVMEEVPQLGEKIQSFTRDYRANNSIQLTRAAAELRYPPEEVERISETAWEAEGQTVTVPASPGPVDVLAHVFPDVFRVARDKLLRLLALIATPNGELERADIDNTLPELLDQEARRLRHVEADQLLDLLIQTSEELKEQFAGKIEALGPVASLFGLRAGGEQEEEVEVAKVTVPPAENGSDPRSSTPSPVDTDGPRTTSSTESPTPVSAGSEI